MKLHQLDRHDNGNQPLRLALRWLETLTKPNGPVCWNAEQLAAARQALADARELLEADVLTLAGKVHPRQGEASGFADLSMGDGYEPARLPSPKRSAFVEGDPVLIASGQAFNDTFHKVRAEVSRNLWDRIWRKAVDWERERRADGRQS